MYHQVIFEASLRVIYLINLNSLANETIRTEILEPYEYVLNPKLQNSRYSVSNTEAYVDNSPVIKVIFTIRDLRLSDNGLYRCVFNQSYKDVNLEVYS